MRFLGISLVLVVGFGAAQLFPFAPRASADQVAPSAATPAAAEQASPLAALPVEQHTLPNGLRVVLSVERSVPTVAVAIYYDVGSRNEEVGRSGFAHLFEHMMFQGLSLIHI